MNLLLVFIGWVIWNYTEFSISKDSFDEADLPFNFKAYFSKKWDNWIGSLLAAVCLLLIGHLGLGYDLVTTFSDKLEWSQLYYLGSGAFYESIVFGIRKMRGKTLADKK